MPKGSPCCPGPQRVESHAAARTTSACGLPEPLLLDELRPPQIAVLENVVGFRRRAEDLADDREQQRPHDASADLVLAESVSMAMLVVLETLTPDERAVFVLREVFDFDYEEIASAVHGRGDHR
ncbi:sigma factor-like helix-turn-helix DNA-binding protein [[Actinomadura] parvosata]|uniref:sigma factor-like helix-turn-helix DNA-binding protein n=1 Tax=[Actinomadura] parvosata TaxID=1955412 RepID=UPI00406C51FB